MNFLVIGGDAAGMSAASRAKRNQADMNVTVLEMTSDVSYSACGMPYNIADPDRDMEDLVVRRAEVFRQKQGINLLTGHCAEKIDPASKTVSGRKADGEGFSFSYDKLLIATGASPVIPDIPGMDLRGIMPLKSLEDGKKIKEYLKNHNVRKAVITGMGYIGLEMCEALRHRGIQVDMVKPRPGLLPWMDKNLSDEVRKVLEDENVGLYDGYEIQKIAESGDGLKIICAEKELEAQMILVGIGVNPASRIGLDAGAEAGPGQSLAVDRRMRTSLPDIYAAGDCADAFHVITGERTWIPLALRANRAGWAVADNVCGIATELPGIVGTAVFKVFDMQVARTGLTEKEAKEAGFEPASVSIKTRSRAHAHPGSQPLWVHMTGDKKSGRLLGVQMVGKDGVAHRINAPAVALHAGMSVEAFFQTDMAYAPPFGPVWDPVLTAANQLLKKL
ncbi:MAG: FAD-dependent oxidoreductase [Desulfococcaceae bacterium]|jgi:NADPH-dependent 2,4-dienoyl-CoA reductase/sulfur reductase-like enzyme|nr:FAD-dependent oxidoreductase [Desulfococcaceae bacterium]